MQIRHRKQQQQQNQTTSSPHHQQQQQQTPKSWTTAARNNKRRPPLLASCSFGFCAHVAKLGNQKVSGYFFQRGGKTTRRTAGSLIEAPPKCPTIGLFPPLNEHNNNNKNGAGQMQISGLELAEQMEKCIENAEFAIARLEQFAANKNVLADLRDAFDGREEEVGEEEEKKEKGVEKWEEKGVEKWKEKGVENEKEKEVENVKEKGVEKWKEKGVENVKEKGVEKWEEITEIKEERREWESVGEKGDKREMEMLTWRSTKNRNRELVEQFVLQVRDQFQLAKQIERIVPSFFAELCSDCPEADEEISSEQMLSKKFANLLDAAIRFDSLKVATPTLQNSFSLFRRMCLLKSYGAIYGLTAPMSDQIVFFLSRPAPLFTSIANSANHFIAGQRSRELATSHLIEALIVIYNVLKKMLQRLDQFQNIEKVNGSGFIGGTEALNQNRENFERAMIGVLLVVDHIERGAGGVFIPANSPFDISDFMSILKANGNSEQIQQNLATLRFMSRHFADPEIPAYIRKMFENFR